MSEALILALTTEANQEQAEALARALLAQRLATCVALQPQRALYWWEGRIEASDEVQPIIVPNNGRPLKLRCDNHSYATPEFLCWPAEASADYASWARSVIS